VRNCLRLKKRWDWRSAVVINQKHNSVMGSKLLKNQFMGVVFDQIFTKMAIEKNRRFVIFRVRFWRFLSKMVPIRIYRKTGPTKSTVLGPRPPPGENIKFIDFWPFLLILGSSIEPEKASVKSASTPYPPWKVNFIGISNNLLPNFVPHTIF
jgi:hypothetical protein